tara:strand:- start:162 stop:731 length:570 start_codon:yes stop_codon:yes gene_type:complete
MVGISSIISGLAAPISSVINKFVTRKEDQMRAQAEIERIQKDFESKVLDNQNNLLSAQKELVLAEVNGHWFQRNWRPALMWIIIAIIANNYLIAPIVNQLVTVFGGENILPLLDLPDKLFNLMTIGLGGYVVGRSAEKIIPQMAESKALIAAGTTPEELEEKKVKKAQFVKAVATATRRPETPNIGPKF